MGLSPPPDAPPARRGRGEDGAALVEFALVIPLLLLFLFGIITFGLILSFKQGITQAAAEGARAAAVVPGTDHDQIVTVALDAAASGVEAFGRECNEGALTCVVSVPAPCADGYCVTVTVSYDYASAPLIAPFPVLSAALPSTISSSSTVRVNPPR